MGNKYVDCIFLSHNRYSVDLYRVKTNKEAAKTGLLQKSQVLAPKPDIRTGLTRLATQVQINKS